MAMDHEDGNSERINSMEANKAKKKWLQYRKASLEDMNAE